MMNRLMNRSQLRELNSFYATWPDAVILAEAEQEEFVNVEIITTAAYRKETAFEQSCNIGGDLDEIETRMKTIERSLSEVEFIEIFKNKIRVCLNAPQVDDNLVDRALFCLGKLDNFNIGSKVILDESYATNH